MKPRLMITTANDTRDKHLDALARFLGPTDSLVVTVDVYADDGRMILQVPLDPEAEVVAREHPRLQPGGLTEIISYIRCPKTTQTLELTVDNAEVRTRREIVPQIKRAATKGGKTFDTA